MSRDDDVRERHRDVAPVEKPTALAKLEPEPIKGASLIEFSTHKQEDVNENVGFGDSPVHCSCPHCERCVVTFIDYEASWVSYLLGVVVWFSLGWMAFWVLPLLWPAFKDVVHHCPRCLNVIARKSRIALPSFRSEVMTLKIGSCAVVLARKYVVILCGLLMVIVTVAILRSTVHISPGAASRETMPKGEPSALTWEDFLRQCGPRSSLGHRTTSAKNFEEHFRKKTFKWQGEVMHIREGFDVFFLHAKSVVMVRMNPSRYPRRDIPDIALLFSEDRNREVAPLMTGDLVDFEATFTAHGHRGDPEVMTLWHINQAKPIADATTAAPEASVEDTVAETPAPVRQPLPEQAEPAKQAEPKSEAVEAPKAVEPGLTEVKVDAESKEDSRPKEEVKPDVAVGQVQKEEAKAEEASAKASEPKKTE